MLGIILVIFAYFLGNISIATILGRLHGIDIKSKGSGNAGTTNVLRVLGKKQAIITLIVDISKGVIPVVLARILASDFVMLCMLFVILGHIYPILFKFKGGKGVATAFGALLAYYWPIALLELTAVAVGLVLTKRMSAGTLLAALLCPVFAVWLKPDFLYYSIALAILIILKHRQNIVRLINGSEPRIGEKAKS